MNLARLAAERAKEKGPLRVGLIGAGKFGSMFLAQAPFSPGLQVTAIADLAPDRVRENLAGLGWSGEAIGGVALVENGRELAERDDVDVVIEATGSPIAGTRHALAAIEAGKHLVMVTVEADVLLGPALAKRAREAGVVYSAAYGDQPALIAEMVDWARATGFSVACAGKGTKYLPGYHEITPDDVWEHYGLTRAEAGAAGMNPQMFNSFIDGTKSSIEMAAVANMCGLDVPEEGLVFPPCGADDLASTLGRERDGQVEVVSSLGRNGENVEHDLRWGVYCVFEAPTDYAAACFRQYGLQTDASGRYGAMYKPYHLIGLELGISVYSAALRGEPTGASREMRGDVACVAKRDLKAGEALDGEGGYTVWGRLMPAGTSVRRRALPIGLAHGATMTRDVARGEVVTHDDVDVKVDAMVAALREEAWTTKA